MYIERVISFLVEHGADPERFEPCTEADIGALEARIGRPLPLAYREFLLTMGRDSDGVFASDDCHYDDLPKIERLAHIMLKGDSAAALLPDDAFVFYYAGYQFLFFRTSEGDDPPVYYYMEGDAATASLPRTYEHYTDFLMLAVQEWI